MNQKSIIPIITQCSNSTGNKILRGYLSRGAWFSALSMFVSACSRWTGAAWRAGLRRPLTWVSHLLSGLLNPWSHPRIKTWLNLHKTENPKRQTNWHKQYENRVLKEELDIINPLHFIHDSMLIGNSLVSLLRFSFLVSYKNQRIKYNWGLESSTVFQRCRVPPCTCYLQQ